MQPENETETTDTDTTEADTDAGESSEEEERRFTQAEVDKLTAKARRQGGQATAKQIAEQLGVTPDEAAKLIADAKERREAEMSEVEKARAEAETAKAEAAKVAAEAAAKALRADLALKLNSGTPINPDRIEMALDLAVSRAAGMDDVDDPATEVVEWLREQSPEWFGSKEKESSDSGSSTSSASRRTNGEAASGQSGKSTTASKFEEWKKSRKTPGLKL